MKYFLGILLFLFSTFVQAWEIVSVDSVGITVRYTEPTQNVDDSPLIDLQEVRAYADVGQTGAFTFIQAYPASSPTGGGTSEQQVIVPVGDGQEANVDVYLTAVDGSGNQSHPSNTNTVRVDRLAPKTIE